MEYRRICDFYLPPRFLRLYDGPATNIEGTWRILGRHVVNKAYPDPPARSLTPKVSIKRKATGLARYAFWQGGEFFQNAPPQREAFRPVTECTPEILKSMEACIQQMRVEDSSGQMTDRGRYISSQFGPLSKTCMVLMEGYVAGGSAKARPRTDTEFERGYMAFVHTKLSRVISVSELRADAIVASHGMDESMEAAEQHDAVDGLLHGEEWEWEGAEHAVPIISSSTTALHLPGIFEKLGHANVILTAGSGCFGHKGGPTCGAHACQQAEEAWKAWKSGKYGDMSLSDAVIEFAQTHEELRGAFLTFQQDADRVYPGWREKLSSAGMSPLEMAHARVARQVLGQSSSAALHLDEDSLMKRLG